MEFNIPSKGVLKQGCEPVPTIAHTGNTLVNIRGTNGSGKTYTVRQIVSNFPCLSRKTIEVDGAKGLQTIAYYDHGDFYLIGSYENDCGGLDTVRDFYSIAPLALKLLEEKSVLMEGLLWSSVFSSMHKLEHECRTKGHQVVWCGFDYPVETMINRVVERRVKQGNTKPLPIKNLLQKVKPVCSGLNHAIYFGSNVLIGDSDFLQAHVTEILKNNTVDNFPFKKQYYSISDYDLWKARLDSDEEYSVSPGAELVAASRSTNSLLDLL